MPNKLYEALRGLFIKPKDKQKYLVQVNEVCPYLHQDSPEWQIVESSNPVKRGMHHSYNCGGYEFCEDKTCQECGYKRTKKITAVEIYSFKRAQALKARSGVKSLKDLL